MSTKIQFQKNIDLSGKFMNYVVSGKASVSNFPQGGSFVMFSAKDKTLNSANQKLVQNLTKKGQKVIKILETGNKTKPWAFTPVAY